MEATADSGQLSFGIARFKRLGHFSIVLAAIACYYRIIIRVTLFSLICLIVALSNPLILRELLKAISDRSYAPIWFQNSLLVGSPLSSYLSYPLLCAIALALCSLTSIFATHYLFFLQPNMAFRLRTVLNALIFEKALRQQRSSQQTMTSGFIVNLVANDSLKIQTLVVFLHSTWYHPLSLLMIVLLLYRLVGYPALVGGASLILLLSCSITIARKQGRVRAELSALADRRISLTRETLLHIKAAKSQGWEDSLCEKIDALRQSEALLAKKLARLSGLFSICSGTAPAVAMSITSILMVTSGSTLEAATLFPILTLFMQLRFSLNHLPETIHSLVDANIAIKRIFSFLSAPDFKPSVVRASQQHAVIAKEFRTEWSPGGPCATNIQGELCIPRGELIVIVGAVGAGKTALLLSILGELTRIGGELSLGGRTAYVPQTPWIISETLRNNITFGRDFNNSLYQRAVFAAGLRSDIQTLPSGDSTQIGERGINLSGGQRHRVSLARALYSDAEIYLLDDPLSALDPQVARHVFDQLICQDLSSKTRILVSHRLEFALEADRVLVMENGQIVEQGSPKNLQENSTRFNELLHFHRKMTEDSTERALIPSASNAVNTLELDSEIDLDISESGEQIIQSEERRVGAVSGATIRSYFSRLAPGFALAVLALLFIGRQCAALATDLWLTRWSSVKQIDLTIFLGGYLAFIILLAVMGYMRTLRVLSCGLHAGVLVHRSLLRGVLRAPLTFFEANPVGRVLNRFSRDLENVELALPRALLDAGHCVVETITVCLVITFVAPLVFVVIIPVAIIYYLIGRFFKTASRDLQRLNSLSLSPIFSILSECLAGIESLRASALGEQFTERYTLALNAHTRINYIQTGTNRWLGLRLESLGAAIICSIGISIALTPQAPGGIALSGLSLSYAIMMTSAMAWAIRSVAMVESSLTSYERLERYANTPSEITTGAAVPAGWPSRGAITINELSTRYKPGLPLALNNISCSIPAGSRVGIIGRTGSGKSTLILSLLRLIEPCSGKVIIDGVDLADIKLSDLRGALSVVPQEPILFSGPLRESLDPFHICSDTEISAALMRVGLKEMVDSLPSGLQSVVNEGGANFSAGQRQLICLARALLRQSKVIILDEATAAIDAQADYLIQNVLRNELLGATVLVVAHRLPTVLDADLIMGLKLGELVEFDTPAELLQRGDSLLNIFLSEFRRGRDKEA